MGVRRDESRIVAPFSVTTGREEGNRWQSVRGSEKSAESARVRFPNSCGRWVSLVGWCRFSRGQVGKSAPQLFSLRLQDILQPRTLPRVDMGKGRREDRDRQQERGCDAESTAVAPGVQGGDEREQPQRDEPEGPA